MRRLWVLVSQLPRESRVARAEAPAAQWSTTDYLLASVIDAVAINTWAFISAHSKGKVKQPEPIPRPGDDVKVKDEPKTGSGLAALIAAMGGGDGGSQ